MWKEKEKEMKKEKEKEKEMEMEKKLKINTKSHLCSYTQSRTYEKHYSKEKALELNWRKSMKWAIVSLLRFQ